MDILFAGFGDIAQRLAAQVKRRVPDSALHALSKTSKSLTLLDSHHCVDLSDQEALADVLSACKQNGRHFDYIFIILAPSGLDGISAKERYERSYLSPVQNITALWNHYLKAPKRVFFISSTSVYHQTDGSWVDERSSCEPTTVTGQILLAAEEQLLVSELPTSVVRFSGIYSEQRRFLIRSVIGGNCGSEQYTNRIHAIDAAGALAHLLHKHELEGHIDSLYLASDCEPASSRKVCSYIAERLQLDPDRDCVKTKQTRAGNKRCRNTRLLNSGFQFEYPSFREGYAFVGNDTGSYLD